MNHLDNFSHPYLDDARRKSGITKFIGFYEKSIYSCIDLPVEKFEETWLDIGAGSGSFFLRLSKFYPRTLFVAIERDRMRAKSLLRRAQKCGMPNLVPIRGNVISLIATTKRKEWIDRMFILYPCPWPKKRHKKNRWYFHPIMPCLIDALKVNGKIIWASDEEFYIEEAYFTFQKYFNFKVLEYGQVQPNDYNELKFMPAGRTKFEEEFFLKKRKCFELVVEKPYVTKFFDNYLK